MIAAGQTIGNYRILNKIGTGGMGAVYLAEHPLIGKKVALKVIHRELAGNRDVVSRFFQEARSVNKIGNEHIVEIHDFGVTPEGDHFFIMEYLEGRTLASILSREKAFDIMRALHIGAQIANALAAAHAAGIIHRDLKPDNIMLMKRMGDQDFVKVLDFGLAKVFSAATAVKTAAGVLLGTPQYMSPEACESKGDVDHRTDIYALGVLLFQMMTGVLPFDGESMGEVLVKQVTALPPVPRALNPTIPPSVEQILLRCLAKRVDARFATMMALREALLDPEAYLRGSPPIAPARSVGDPALGEARTMMVPAAALQQTRMAPGPQLPLPAPAPSMMGSSGYPALGHGRGNHSPQTGQGPTMLAASGAYHLPARRAQTAMPGLSPPLEPKMNTMRIATPVGYTSRPPRKVWPIVLVASLLLGLGGGVFAVARFGHGSKHGGDGAASSEPGAGSDGATDGSGASASGSGAAGSGAGEANGAAGSSAGTTSGSSVAGTTSGSGASTTSGSSAGGATSGSSAAGTTSGSSAAGTTSGSSASGATSGSSAGGATSGSSAGGATSGSSAAGATSGSGAGTEAKLPTARLSIDSVPSGAAVAGPDGATLGKTPLKIDWPISDLPVTFELRLGGYRKKQRQTVVNSNTALHVELERLPVVHHPVAPKPNDDGDNGLMRP